jgi:hypothetical protein
MAIIVNNKTKQYENATEGVHSVELVNVKELNLTTQFGQKDVVQFIWLTDQRGKDGTRVSICQRFSKTLHEKSQLRKFLTQCGLKNLESLDLETLLHSRAQVVVSHTENKGRTFVNISAVLPNTFHSETAEERQQRESKQYQNRASEPSDLDDSEVF